MKVRLLSRDKPFNKVTKPEIGRTAFGHDVFEGRKETGKPSIDDGTLQIGLAPDIAIDASVCHTKFTSNVDDGCFRWPETSQF